MKKRPDFDLSDLTTTEAVPMPEAQQRVAKTTPPARPLPESITRQIEVEKKIGSIH